MRGASLPSDAVLRLIGLGLLLAGLATMTLLARSVPHGASAPAEARPYLLALAGFLGISTGGALLTAGRALFRADREGDAP